MKTARPSRHTLSLQNRLLRTLSLILLTLLLAAPSFAALELSVAPSALDREAIDPVRLTATGLAGSELTLTLHVDVDADGTVDAEDWIVWSDLVPDGVTEWSPAMPVDVAAAAGTVAVDVEIFSPFGYPHMRGSYVWEARDASNGQVARTSFAVTALPGSQSVSGRVLEAGSAQPLAGAMLLLLPINEDCDGAFLTTVTDAAGQYEFELPADVACSDRIVLAARPGYVGSLTNQPHVVFGGSDHFSGVDVVLTPGSHAVSGQVRYASGPRSGQGIPGVTVFAESDAGFALLSTDKDGTYAMTLPEGEWEFRIDDTLHLATQGAISDEDAHLAELEVTGPGAVPAIEVPAANAFVRGVVRDASGNPLARRSLSSWRQGGSCDGDCYEISVVSSADGSYTLGLIGAPAGETWRYEIELDGLEMGQVARALDVDLTDGAELTGQDVEHVMPSAFVHGSFSQPNGEPLANLCLVAELWGEERYRARARVGCDGSFVMPAIDGTWQIRTGNEDFLGPYRDVDVTELSREVSVNGADVYGVDFILGGWSEAPSLHDVEPMWADAGAQVLLSGAGWPSGSAPVVRIGGVVAPVVAHRPEIGKVVVEIPAGLPDDELEIVFENAELGMTSNALLFEPDGGTHVGVCSIDGRLTTGGGAQSAAGALVIAMNGAGFVRASVADASGHYALALADNAPHDLLFIPPVGEELVWSVRGGAACASSIDHDFVGGVVLTGRVESSDGDEVAGAFVEADNDSGSFFTFTLTDGEGRYSLVVPNGETLKIEVQAPYESHLVSGAKQQHTVSGPAELGTTRLTLGRLVVGHVVDRDRYPLRAIVEAWSRDSGQDSGEAMSRRGDGRFALAVPNDGSYGLSLFDERQDDAPETRVQWIVAQGDTRTSFPFPVAHQGIFPSDDGEPRIGSDRLARGQAGALLHLRAEGIAGDTLDVLFKNAEGDWILGEDTDADAARGLVVTRVPADAASGPMRLRVDGNRGPKVAFERLAGTAAPGNLTLSGQVTGSAGAPLPGALVLLFVSDPADPDCDTEPTLFDVARTDGSGHYTLSHPGGDLFGAVWADAASTDAPGLIDLAGVTSDRTENIALQAGQPVHIRVVAGDPAQPVARARFELDGDTFDFRLTDANGEATLYAPPSVEQDYEVQGPIGGRLPLSEVAATAPHDFGDVALPVGVMLSGAFVDENYAPLVGAEVSAYGDGQGNHHDHFYGVTGRWGLGSGPVPRDVLTRLFVKGPSDEVADFLGDVPTGQSDLVVHPAVVLPAGGVVEGTVSRAEGGPAGDVGVAAFDYDNPPFHQAVLDEGSCDDGFYRLKLPVGDYALSSWGDAEHLQGWYTAGGADTCVDEAARVSVTRGATVAHVDLEIAPRASITGEVRLYESLQPGTRVTLTGPELGSCGIELWTDGAGAYAAEVPAGADYRVRSDAPAGFTGPDQCYSGFDGCTNYTPVSVDAGDTEPDISFRFGLRPDEVSGDHQPPLLVTRSGDESLRLRFAQLPPDPPIVGYHVYQGTLANTGTASDRDCGLHPDSFINNGDGTLTHLFTPVPGAQWFLVSASSVIGEAPLGSGRGLSNACGVPGRREATP